MLERGVLSSDVLKLTQEHRRLAHAPFRFYHPGEFSVKPGDSNERQSLLEPPEGGSLR